MRTCSEQSCERKHFALGLCRNHYVASKGYKRRRTVACATCSAPIDRYPGSKNYYCSWECRSQARADRVGKAVKIPNGHPVARLMRGLPADEEVTPRRARFVDTACSECGSHYLFDLRVTGNAAKHCSRRCSKRAERRVRRGREQGRSETFRWVEVIAVWMAMGKRCAYCSTAMTEQPEPDHVIPLSRGGHNDLGNILPACRPCNSQKRDLTLDEWARDREQRGLEPRITDYVTFDKRASHLVLRAATARAA